MPWSISNTVTSLSNKSEKVKEIFAKAANDALSRGLSEEEAIFSGLGAVKNYEKKNTATKAVIKKQEVPSHIRAMLEAKEKVHKELVVEEVTREQKPRIRKEFLGDNAIESDPSRSLVSVQWDNQGRLILNFDDGEQIITAPVPVSENIEQHVGVVVKEELVLPEQYDHIQFNLNSTSEVVQGRLVWNPDEGTLDLGMNHGGIVQHIGLETYIRVKNTSGVPIPDGSAVIYTGAVGNSGHLKVALATAVNADPSSLYLGLATSDIAVNDFSFITNFGLVKGIDTTGTPVGQVWQDGETLFLHPTLPGKLTNIPPVPPNRRIIVGYVVHAHTNGQIFSRPDFGFKLRELDDLDADAPNHGDVIKYDSASQTWKNQPDNTSGDAPEVNPQFTYDVEGNVSRIDYTSGNYKLFTYTNGLISQLDYVKGLTTYRKVFIYDNLANLLRIEDSIF